MFERHAQNPLIHPNMVKASRPDFEVIGTFNAGVTRLHNETILLLRVAERPLLSSNGVVRCPHLSPDGELLVEEIDRKDPNFDTSDPRVVFNVHTGEALLTSISHFRLARSNDGINFTIAETPWIAPSTPDEGFGIEDARITQVEDIYYINYTAVSRRGIATALVTTRDFVTFERHGVIFPPANRDVTFFPQRINGMYVCYHRPMPGMFGGYNIWMASSPDMTHWGQHRVVLEAKPGGWEGGRVGGGAPPIYTEHGWLSIYHAADKQDRYCLGAFLTPHAEPDRIIASSPQPILSPEAIYETEGYFQNVVFTCGAIVNGDELWVYYGAGDESIALAVVGLQTLIDGLT